MNKKISYLKNPRHKINKAPILMTTVSRFKIVTERCRPFKREVK